MHLDRPVVAVLIDRERVSEQRRPVDLHRVVWHVPAFSAAELNPMRFRLSYAHGAFSPMLTACENVRFMF
jgi:hypothetical protein